MTSTSPTSRAAETLRGERRAGALLSPRRRGDRPARRRPVTTAFRSGGRLVVVPAVERSTAA
jgi:hypothetical protein